VIYGILEDDSGNLWLSTNYGISKFNPRDEIFKNYDEKYGLQDNEFNRNAWYKSKKGEMFFGGINGLNVFYPENIKDNPHIPPVVITKFNLLNRPISVGEMTDGRTILKKPISETQEIELTYKDYFFSFEFSSLDYIYPEKNQYAYMLEGLDKDWNYIGDRRFANYTNVDAGEYIFRVKASNNDGVWNEEGTSIKITITPPWWKTNQAYFIFIILIISIIYTGLRFKINRERLKNELKLKDMEAGKFQELDRMKSHFFANISHEFRTPLTLILGPMEKLLSSDLNENKGNKGNIKNHYKLITRNANRLLRLVDQLLDLSKLEAGKLSINAVPVDCIFFLKGLFHSFMSLAERKQITMRFKSDSEEIILYFDFDKMEKIFSNLLSNAFKFTPAGGS
ncbi:MAG: hybrid sensor histidine kinase/response regulator, partial [Calditrichia bacterium]|nr:hybrid sensor histidine kinase/response regulator [Calditrichia bacterium]